MSELEELAKRLDKLEKEQRNKWKLFLQYFVSPLLLVAITIFFDQRVERAKQGFMEIEVQVKQIEAAQRILSELFSDIPERAFIADRLMSKLLDENLSHEISEMVMKYYAAKYEKSIEDTSFTDAEKIAATAKTIGGPAADSLTSKISGKLYYIVVASPELTLKNEAIAQAQSLRNKGYDAEVHISNRGYFAVTIGQLDIKSAQSLRREAIKRGDAKDDAYLVEGDRFIKKIFPEL